MTQERIYHIHPGTSQGSITIEHAIGQTYSLKPSNKFKGKRFKIPKRTLTIFLVVSHSQGVLVCLQPNRRRILMLAVPTDRKGCLANAKCFRLFLRWWKVQLLFNCCSCSSVQVNLGVGYVSSCVSGYLKRVRPMKLPVNFELFNGRFRTKEAFRQRGRSKETFPA